jgi:hypothetical protein
MAARVKKRSDTSTNRESDKLIIRLPDGMRDRIAALARASGRSMTAEVVAALEQHLEREAMLAALRKKVDSDLLITRLLKDADPDIDKKGNPDIDKFWEAVRRLRDK